MDDFEDPKVRWLRRHRVEVKSEAPVMKCDLPGEYPDLLLEQARMQVHKVLCRQYGKPTNWRVACSCGWVKDGSRADARAAAKEHSSRS
jgi:hypothetical protein